MTRRFTETDKWSSDEWFRKLTPESKLLYIYLFESCDCAGFWEIDWDRASFQTGLPAEGLKAAFGALAPKLLMSPDGKYCYLVNFLYHQRNLPLNPDNHAHGGIVARINSHNSFGHRILQVLDEKAKDKGLVGAVAAEAPKIRGLNKAQNKGLKISPYGKGKGKGKRGCGGDDSAAQSNQIASSPLTVIAEVLGNTPTETCIVTDKAIALLNAGGRFDYRVNQSCVHCQKHGRPAWVSVNTEDVLYYVCEKCRK